jgi:hypothetical protein
MLTAINQRGGNVFAHCLADRGYNVTYRENEVNFCPGCGRSHWFIGRLLAECAYCGTAVPLSEATIAGCFGGHSRNRRMFIATDLAA